MREGVRGDCARVSAGCVSEGRVGECAEGGRREACRGVWMQEAIERIDADTHIHYLSCTVWPWAVQQLWSQSQPQLPSAGLYEETGRRVRRHRRHRRICHDERQRLHDKQQRELAPACITIVYGTL